MAGSVSMQAAELFDLSGEVAIVTGASSGLGARFAEVLAAHGAKVVLAARRVEKLKELAAKIGASALAAPLDVADREAMPAVFDLAERAYGPVSILINNAGVAVGERFLDTTPEEWEKTRAINLDGVWHMAQEAARRMKARGGTIINISSVLAYRVTPGAAAYCVTKAAVAQMTAAMALELARYKIRVNAIAPGYIVTEMTEAYLGTPESEASRKVIPMRRVGQPSDLDGTLLLLASRNASAFMTGSTIVVDGGHLTAFV
jgi:3-oxoacyl-[acyl-carrier protein] reductase